MDFKKINIKSISFSGVKPKEKDFSVLLVDDEPENIHVFRNILKKDYNVHTATSGAEGLEILKSNPVDLIITDQRMPGMTGIEFLEHVIKDYPQCVRMVLTGYADVDAIIDAINKVKVYMFLMKPVEPQYLKMTIQRALEARKLEKANEELLDNLKVKNKELEQSLKLLKETQNQLVRSEKLAVIGQLAGGIVHEIKNQLGIILFAEMLEMQFTGNEEISKFVKHIKAAVRRIESITEEIRRFSKKSPPSYTKKKVDLSAVLEEAISICMYDKQVKRKKIEKHYIQKPHVECNGDKIIQVFINLLRNAAQAVDRNGQIDITLNSTDQDAIIAVKDNGCGMPEETLNSIWEPFFTTKGEDGTGLGLDICKQIINGHGGNIACESKEGEGSTFTVTLPLLEAVEVSKNTPAE